MSYKLKRDEFHSQIALELSEAGFSVLDLSRVGGGCPDLLIARNGVIAMVEIKTAIGRKAPLERLKPNQTEFHAGWKGPIITAFTASQVLYEFNLLIKRRAAYAINE
jgi:Holliday junction resolvase